MTHTFLSTYQIMIKLKHLLIGVSLILISASSMATIKTQALQSALEQRIAANPTSAGIVVGIVDDKQVRIISAGQADKTNHQKLTDDTLFEIGSITKTFTGILLADMSLKGEVNLDDPIVNYLPKGVTMPTRNGKTIRLRDLATHTSGLPRLPTNFTYKNISNPYVDYSVENLYEFLSHYQLTRDIGSTAEYSNLGMGLLGHVLALKAGKSYEELVTERILIPLGMTDTSISLSTAQKKRIATGHDITGKATSLWDIPTLAGAGALRSSAHDMMIYLQANMGIIKTPLREAIVLSQQFQQPFGSNTLSIGLAWQTEKTPEGNVVWHNGGTGGFRSFIGFNQLTRQGVFVLINSNDNADAIGQAILTNQIKLITQ
jgi:serine-type D-Ala-D-Ala carboxypeptidase/endopeptidase